MSIFDKCHQGVARQLLKKTHMAPSLPHVHIHLLSSNRERHLWLPDYIKFPYVCVYFHPEISSFSGEFSLSFPIYCVIRTLVVSFPHGLILNFNWAAQTQYVCQFRKWLNLQITINYQKWNAILRKNPLRVNNTTGTLQWFTWGIFHCGTS